MTLAGRAGRVREPFATALPDAVDDVVADIERSGNGTPLALFGHSLGAILAYETAHALIRRGTRRPVHLFVAASRAPDDQDENRFAPPADNAELVDDVERRYGAIPAAVRNEPELLALFLPVLRADLQLLADYVWKPQAPLSIPVTAFTGTADRAGPPQTAPKWRAHTESTFRAVPLVGDHFFVHSQLRQVSGIVREVLDG